MFVWKTKLEQSCLFQRPGKKEWKLSGFQFLCWPRIITEKNLECRIWNLFWTAQLPTRILVLLFGGLMLQYQNLFLKTPHIKNYFLKWKSCSSLKLVARALPIIYKYISFLYDAKSHMYKHAAQHLCNETTFSAAYFPATSLMNGKTVHPRKQLRSPKYFHVLHQT